MLLPFRIWIQENVVYFFFFVDSKSVEQVRQVYMDMNFPQIYREYDGNAYKHTRELIADIENKVLRDIMFGMLNDSNDILCATKAG